MQAVEPSKLEPLPGETAAGGGDSAGGFRRAVSMQCEAILPACQHGTLDQAARTRAARQQAFLSAACTPPLLQPRPP